MTPPNASTARDQQLHQWLTTIFPDQDFTHARLPGDASFRGYHRLSVGVDKYIVMDAPPEKESITEFVAVDKLMADVVHVPHLVAIDEAQGFIVMEDLGATDFADVIAKDTCDTNAMAATERHYHTAMQEIIAIQTIDVAKAASILPRYDEALLTREMGLFTEWLLPYVGVSLDTDTQKLWQDLQATIISAVTAQPQVVVHRDFHSRNLMVVDGSDSLGVIDFQDAVLGAYTYDVASLLRDAYINFNEDWVSAQVAKFYQLATIKQQYGKSLDEFTIDFNVMSLQRHLKVLGIFVRLYQRDGKDRYLSNMPKVMGDLQYSLGRLQATGDTTFAAFDAWLQAVLIPKFKTKFATDI